MPDPAAASRGDHGRQSLSIGAVLALLRPEFPDVTISKIRFLEDQGLVEPARTPSGYRKFSTTDIDRLRYVLSCQRDYYLPLRVIREHLVALDDGREPPVSGTGPHGPRLVGPHEGVRDPLGTPPGGGPLSRPQLLDAAQVDEALLVDLEAHGLVQPRPGGSYDADAVVVAALAQALAEYGIEPRHLRSVRTAADRQAALVDQVVGPLRRRRGVGAGAAAAETAREVAALCARLQEALVSAALERGPAG